MLLGMARIPAPASGQLIEGAIRTATDRHNDARRIRSPSGTSAPTPARSPHTPAHGVWRYLGEGRFGVTMWDIFYDIDTGQLRHY